VNAHGLPSRRSPDVSQKSRINLRDVGRKFIIDHAATRRKEVEMKRLVLSVQRVALFVSVLTTGCASLQHVALNKLGNALAQQGTVSSSDGDPELVGNAIPFSFKLIESLCAG